jgi:hypothetical protein
MNRRVVRLALEALFTADPEKDPALAKVLQSVGLDGKKPILHGDHPVVVGKEDRLPLCPPDTTSKSIVQDGQIPVNAQFINMLGKFFFYTYFVVSLPVICILNFVVCFDRAYSSTRSESISRSAQSGNRTVFCEGEGNATLQRVVCVVMVPWVHQDRQYGPASISRFWRIV